MTIKYLFKSLIITALSVALSSCLGKGSEETEVELSSDAQIYSISFTSKTDSNKVLPSTSFTIDQLNKTIFNRDSLPYLFHVDSVNLNISGVSAGALSKIVINLKNPDSTYTWNMKDSVSFSRLTSIETTAADKKTVRLYQFKANIHQHDPNLIQWFLLAQNYHNTNTIDTQKTVLIDNRFFTYFKSENVIHAMSSFADNGREWNSEIISGLPANTRINSIISFQNNSISACYALDENNNLYKSLNGYFWTQLETQYPLISIYGKLPSAIGDFAILTAIEYEGVKRFAKTSDFSSFEVMNIIPNGIPMSDFASLSIENPHTYSAKYIILSGGTKEDATENNQIWLLQENRNEIKNVVIPNQSGFDFHNNTLFWYDNTLYLLLRQQIVVETEDNNDEGNNEGGTGIVKRREGEEIYENVLYTSPDYGLRWFKTGENQVLPEEFVDRTKTTIITDDKNFIWIFGGVSGTQQISEVWRGRLNKLIVN